MREKRQVDGAWIKNVDDTLVNLKQGQQKLALAQEENTRITNKIQHSVDDHHRKMAPILEAVETMQGGVRVLGKIGTAAGFTMKFIGKIIRIGAPIAAAVATVWLAARDEIIAAVKWLHGLWPWK